MLLTGFMEDTTAHPLVQFRELSKLSRAEVAKLAKTTRQTIYRIETGDQTPSLDLVGRLVRVAEAKGGTLTANDFLPAGEEASA